MKIATITCHDVYNYGASLQAYALQEYCRLLGHDYIIIDYKPPYLSNHYKLNAIGNSKYDKPFIRQAYLLAKFPGRLVALKRKNRFDKFTSQYLCVSEERFHSNEQLKESIKADKFYADIYIAGSDQIWNTFFNNGRDASFYLDFVGDNGRKISYAASFATDKIYNNAKNFVKTELGNFDAISVRESSALALLSALGYNDATLVCDPVFLLDEASWRNLARDVIVPNKEYILVYDCERSERLGCIAQELRKQTNLQIYTISSTFGRYANRNYSNSGPLEFLALIANARYVLANSFHALAFSMIFKKDFFIVNRTEKINTRMRDFLAFVNLDDRLIDNPNQVNTRNIDFNASTSRLEELINTSEEYLKAQIMLS